MKDIQLTPAEHIINNLKSLGATIQIYDPYFSSTTIFGIQVNNNLDEVIQNVDASIIVTGHKEFHDIDVAFFKKMKNPILIDTRGIIEPNLAKQSELIFRGLGRGNF